MRIQAELLLHDANNLIKRIKRIGVRVPLLRKLVASGGVADQPRPPSAEPAAVPLALMILVVASGELSLLTNRMCMRP